MRISLSCPIFNTHDISGVVCIHVFTSSVVVIPTNTIVLSFYVHINNRKGPGPLVCYRQFYAFITMTTYYNRRRQTTQNSSVSAKSKVVPVLI
jgi:hypothetical protein